MPTRKIKEWSWLDEFKPCFHPEHNPPNHRVFEPGLYEHECPECGLRQTFRVGSVFL